MASAPDYEVLTEGAWRLRVLRGAWRPDLWARIKAALETRAPARHPQTVRLRVERDGGSEEWFLKIFDRGSGFGALKDFFRDSKALRSLRMGLALSEAGFHAPTAVAAGEERRRRGLERAFLVTLPVAGETLPAFLRGRLGEGGAGALAQKRSLIAELARQVRQFHQLGFVHGDLLPTNIMISPGPGGPRFVFLDNDRTRRYPTWLPHGLWRRNLVQLNRLALPGITLQDRVRFFRAYCAGAIGDRERRILRRLERETRRRRAACDGIRDRSFRSLMRWQSDRANKI